jgi:HAMP domain-containing protein
MNLLDVKTLLLGSGNRPLSRQLAISLSIIFTLFILLSVLAMNQLFAIQARNLIEQRSGFLMDAMLAVREYTSKNVNPIVAPLNEGPGVFRPEAVPSHSAQTVFEYLKSKPEYRNYSYREAALNPTNLRDKADSFETSIIERFRNNPSLKTITGERDTALQSMYYVASPLKVSKQSCLACHSTPQKAPASQLLSYGDSNGFDWKLNEIIGAQIVTVPQKAVFEAKDRSLFTAATLFSLAFASVAFVTNNVLNRLILRPMREISRKAQEASTNPSIVSFDERNRQDEIGLLASSFERMKQSLLISMNMLQARKDRP